jgi:hypothetical protein
VRVELLTNTVPTRQVNALLRSYLATSNRGQIIKWFGLPAAKEFVPGCDPTGHCVGTIGDLIVLDGTKLFWVSTQQRNQTAAQQEIRSFRLLNDDD